MNWKEKIQENLTSIKFWVWGASTALLCFHFITEYTWAGITAGLMGMARVFEYYTKNNNGKTT